MLSCRTCKIVSIPLTLLCFISTVKAERDSKLKYIFRSARFFIIKSNNYENVALSKARGIWSTMPQNEARLNQAYRVRDGSSEPFCFTCHIFHCRDDVKIQFWTFSFLNCNMVELPWTVCSYRLQCSNLHHCFVIILAGPRFRFRHLNHTARLPTRSVANIFCIFQ